MAYTVSEKADKKVQQDIDIIKKIIIERLNPISIILFGGFGRGEGSFIIENRKILPLNDYDLYVITKKKVPDRILDEIGKECSKAIGRGGLEFYETPLEVYDKNKFFHVDLRCLTPNQLRRLKKINRTYELKHASTVIYGEDVRGAIKDFSLPFSESFRYLMNPACQLIVCMDRNRLKNAFRGDEKILAVHYINKVYLACASALLISAGKFSPTYIGTCEEFKKIYGKKFPGLSRRIEEATRFKLRPNFDKKKDITAEWFQARDDLTFTLKYLAEKHLNIRTNELKGVIREIYKKLPYTYFTPYLPFGFLSRFMFSAQYLLNVLYFQRTGYAKVLLTWKDVGIRIALAAFLLLYALDNEEIKDEAESYINAFAPLRDNNWDSLRKALLYAYDKYFSQKLI